MDAGRRRSPQVAALNERVAEAADAWLVDPRDVGVYGRLVAAIEARRAWLNPTLDAEEVDVPPGAAEAEAGDDAAAGGAEVDAVEVPRVGEGLESGDPREVLERLRTRPPDS
jgi:hypothetical protein